MGIVKAVKLRLKMFEIEVDESADGTLQYSISKSINSINNLTNQNYTVDTFPNSLLEILVDKVVGEYLQILKITKNLPEIYNFDLLATQIKLGDTSINLGENTGSNDEKRLDNCINYLLFGRDNELVRYRRMAK